jgi:hypothetical protein
MLRTLFVWTGLMMMSMATGCSMCQDCQDHNGPVADSPNFGDYAHSPRSGTASASMHSYDGPIEAEPTPVESEAKLSPTPASMPAPRSRR